jgi:SAM-dependent methyltransferase
MLAERIGEQLLGTALGFASHAASYREPGMRGDFRRGAPVSALMPGRLDNALERMHAGEAYFDYITSQESDRQIRAAFQQRVLELAPPRAALLDFGAGPGIDARFFAERGFTVHAYDVDPRMSDFFADHCGDLIEAGSVTLQRGSYVDFLTSKNPGPPRRADLIISNFAPLNLVEDLAALFERFEALSAPHGRILASVINPYYRGDMKCRWWWRRLPELWRRGCYFMPGPQAPHMRRGLADFALQSSPHFKLTRVFAGYLGGPPAGVVPTRARLADWWHLRRGRFIFLQFDK